MKFILIIFFLMAFLVSCKTVKHQRPDHLSGQYESVFPDDRARQQFNEMSGSVIRLTSYVNYQLSIFENGSQVTLDIAEDTSVLAKIRARDNRNESFNGTAFIIAQDDSSLFLVTCAHTVTFPDTIISWDNKADNNGNRFLLSIARKSSSLVQASFPERAIRMKILCIDESSDLALLQTEEITGNVNPLSAAQKLCTTLQWGDRLWIAGFPTGRFMLTTGLAGKPGSDGIFATDAPLSEGYSGSPVMVYDIEAKSFGLAGVARSVPAKALYVLKPEFEIHEAQYNPTIPYTGPVYAATDYKSVAGVSLIVTSERVISLMQEAGFALKNNMWMRVAAMK
jgi:S1-C subfamily serine protease